MLLFRISVRLSVELSLPLQSASPNTLEQLPVYFYQGGRSRDVHFSYRAYPI